MKKILNGSHDAVNIRDKSNVIKKLERRLSSLVSKKYTEKNCIRFVKRLKREQDMLFTFLKTGTDSHNNTAEKPNVVIRKITNGHRTDDGATSSLLHKLPSIENVRM
ncbi:MAG: Transposase [Cenarchaeum symbiont of Oopsacas minuta]|nr:Transposase [Cenarchaeum symbiont of Oopsacas minuta]